MDFGYFVGSFAAGTQLDSSFIFEHYFHIWSIRKRAATEIFHEVIVMGTDLVFTTYCFPISNALDGQ